VAWAKTYGNFDPERLVVVSRGGAAPWYSHITPHYEEIFSHFSPDEFRQANERRIDEQAVRQKHLDLSSFDREIIARVSRARGLSGAEVLHPSLMYQLFDHFHSQRAGHAGGSVHRLSTIPDRTPVPCCGSCRRGTPAKPTATALPGTPRTAASSRTT
jgi:hypothetical protein